MRAAGAVPRRDVRTFQVESRHGGSDYGVALNGLAERRESVSEDLVRIRHERRQQPGDAVPATIVDDCTDLFDGQCRRTERDPAAAVDLQIEEGRGDPVGFAVGAIDAGGANADDGAAVVADVDSFAGRIMSGTNQHGSIRHHTQDEALQVRGLQATRRHRMVRGRPATLEDLDVASLLTGDLRNQFGQHFHSNQSGTAAKDHEAAWFRQLDRLLEELTIPAHRLRNRGPIAGELRRVKYAEAKPPLVLDQEVQLPKYVGPCECDVRQAVPLGILACEDQRRFRHVDAFHASRPGFGRVQSKGAGIAERVQDCSPCREPGGRQSIVALVVVEPGLLAFRDIHQKRQSMLLDRQVWRWKFAREQAVVQFEAFQCANSFLGPHVYPARLHQFSQDIRKQFASLRNPQGGELNGEPPRVLVDRTARHPVRLAEYETATLPRPAKPERFAKPNGAINSVTKKVAIERPPRLPRIEPDADLALAVEQSASDEISSRREQIDLRALGRLAFNSLDRPREDPRVPGEERLRPLRL